MYRSRCKNTRRKLKYCEEDNDGVMGHHSQIIIQTQPAFSSLKYQNISPQSQDLAMDGGGSSNNAIRNVKLRG